MQLEGSAEILHDSLDLKSPLILPDGVTVPNRFFKSAMSGQLGDGDHNPKPGAAEVELVVNLAFVGIDALLQAFFP